ncbi:hypothetical protein B0J11DRAFT_301443 [Dendryphion nanum]|uniref:Cyanovirin-N domain-containing protein n=1 Tax=Dendryphion nanum TaxID=256645 RepID=A0A9P9DU25_9PLEO|nr:hypothetical protein B0J11DRAFT_301443 [Dendryphion nanum]
MKWISSLSSIAPFIILPFARSAPVFQAQGESISSRCINSEMRQEWFIADCLTGEDATTRIKSAVNIRDKVVNNNGTLLFDSTGGGYARSCEKCALSNLSVLTCTCRLAWSGGKWDTTPRVTSLNLESRISVYNGHLLSNTSTSNPTPPTTPSKYPIPSSFEYGWDGNATCPDSNTDDWCHSISSRCPASTALNDFIFRDIKPVHCYVPRVYMPNHFVFSDLKVVGEGAWRLEGWDNEECKGEPVLRIGAEERGICKIGAAAVRAVTVVPEFNGDPW